MCGEVNNSVDHRGALTVHCNLTAEDEMTVGV